MGRIIDGVGKYNDVTGTGPELPQLKANLGLGWTQGNHVVTSTIHDFQLTSKLLAGMITGRLRTPQEVMTRSQGPFLRIAREYSYKQSTRTHLR